MAIKANGYDISRITDVTHEIIRVMRGAEQIWPVEEEPEINYVNRILNNSDFVDTTGWTSIASTLSATDGNLRSTGNGSQAYAFVYYPNVVSYASGKKIYVRVKFKVTNSVCISVDSRLEASGMSTQLQTLQNSPLQDTEYTKSYIKTLPAGGSGNITVSVNYRYANGATQNGKIQDIIEIMLIDMDQDELTTYTLEQMDALPFKA
jgi:hypothetical protein